MFLGSRSYQTSVSVWMFRETNHFHASKFPAGAVWDFFRVPGASSSKGRLRTSTFLGAGTANSVFFARWLSEQQKARWWFQIFFCSQPRSVGKWFNFTNMFQMGLKSPTRKVVERWWWWVDWEWKIFVEKMMSWLNLFCFGDESWENSQGMESNLLVGGDLKHLFCSPMGRWYDDGRICFKWVGSSTN